MKLGKPIVFKNIFNVFEDNRGFLSALDIDKLIEKIPNSSFNFEYQLLCCQLLALLVRCNQQLFLLVLKF